MPRITFEEALLTLQGSGPVLQVAREVSAILRERIEGAVIGGVAVGLHGYLRTTADVDVYVGERGENLASELQRAGFAFDPSKREFIKSNVPVHLVTNAQVQSRPTVEEIDGILTVSLGDLVNIKLRSGLANILPAQDLGDVIGLIRANRLSSEFASRIDKDLRAEFRKLVRAVERDS